MDLSSPANIDIPFGRRQICKIHKYICNYLPTLVASSVECKVLSDPTVHLIQCHFSPEIKTHNVILRSHDRYVKKSFFYIANIPCWSNGKTYESCIGVRGLQALVHREVLVLGKKWFKLSTFGKLTGLTVWRAEWKYDISWSIFHHQYSMDFPEEEIWYDL